MLQDGKEEGKDEQEGKVEGIRLCQMRRAEDPPRNIGLCGEFEASLEYPVIGKC